MALPASGLISISDINVELSLASNYASSLNDTALRTLAGVPSGTISFSNFHGKSSWPYTYNMGWIGGGAVDTVRRLNYSNETITSISITLVNNRQNQAGAHSTTHGYFMGGGLAGTTSLEIDGVVFSNETLHNPAATLSVARWIGWSNVSSLAKGYAGGGYAAYIDYATIDGIVFSNDSAFTASATLATARYNLASGCSDVKGYWLGGYKYNPAGYQTEIDGILFSNDTAVNPGATLATARAATGVNSETRLYACGGQNGTTYYTEIDGLQFSNETAINPSAVLSLARTAATGLSTREKGYLLAGNNGTTNYAEIDGILFSNESAINPSAALPETRTGAAGVSGIMR